MARKLIPGFNYETGQPEQRTRADWRDEIRAVVKKGGRRQVWIGETWARDQSGVLLFEVYDTISA